MSESSPLQVPSKKERGLLERLSSLLLREPEDREQLLEVLQQAHERNLLDADALSMIEGVMQVSDLSAGDIMVPRAQMDAINAEDSIDQIVAFAVEKAHSRFPVYEGERDNVIAFYERVDSVVIPNLQRLLSLYRKNNWPIYFTEMGSQRSDGEDLPRAYATRTQRVCRRPANWQSHRWTMHARVRTRVSSR